MLRSGRKKDFAQPPVTENNGPLRIGAVRYLNARPLVAALPELAPEAALTFDHPSRLADALAAGRLDVALIPTIEYARIPGCTIVSDACIAGEGPVLSVKLFGRVSPSQIRRLALDEGSRTSAALVRILLAKRFGIRPQLELLPLDASPHDSSADAVLLIGDRGIAYDAQDFEFVWDLGAEWWEWTGFPFVFAFWAARSGVAIGKLAQVLSAARDAGLQRLPEIARRHAPQVGISEEDCLCYLRDHLKFHLGAEQQKSLLRFFELAAEENLIPAKVELALHCEPT